MTFPMSVQTIILISFQNREVYIISTFKRLTLEAALCSTCHFCLPPFVTLLPSQGGVTSGKEGVLERARESPFGRFWACGISVLGSGCTPCPNQTFPSGFQLCRMQWCSQPWCSWVLWMNQMSAQDLRALPGGLARCPHRKRHQGCSCFQQNP